MAEAGKSMSIGAVWVGTTKSGKKKLSLKFEEPIPAGVYVTALFNDYKSAENQPDYKVMPLESPGGGGNKDGDLPVF